MGDVAADPRLAGTAIAQSVVDLIGNTPLVRLRRISEVEQIPSVLAMKMETTNPGGSSKDRPALEMILAAERDGLLQPGGTIVEPTSGNTGVGLAIVAAQRGYRCVFVMTDKVAPEKISLLEAYGAEVVVCPVAVAPEDPQSYYSVAERLTDELQRVPPQPVRQPGQPAGPREDHRSRAVGADGRAHHPLRRRRRHVRHDHRRRPLPQGAEPRRSRSSPPTPRARCSPADRAGRTSSRASARTSSRRRGTATCTTRSSPISDEESFLTARRVSEVEGILIGGSGGMAVAAAIQVAKRAGARRHRRRAQPRLRPRLPVAGLRRRVDGQLRVPARVRRVRRRRARRPPRRRPSCSTSTPTRRCARPSS